MIIENKHKYHKYERVKVSAKWIVYKCVYANCKHYINTALAIGRVAVCWVCGETFLINKAAATLKRPHCKNCVSSTKLRKKGSDLNVLLELASKIETNNLEEVNNEK